MDSRLVAAFAAEVGLQTLAAATPKSASGVEPAEDLTEDAASVATAAEPSQSAELNGAPPPPDEEGYAWPEGAAPVGTLTAVVTASENEPPSNAPLPSLDELVNRLPSAVRETLDELFRVKFVGVKRVEVRLFKT